MMADEKSVGYLQSLQARFDPRQTSMFGEDHEAELNERRALRMAMTVLEAKQKARNI